MLVELRDHAVSYFLLFIIAGFASLAFWIPRFSIPVENAVTVRLMNRCEITFFYPPLQPVYTIAFGCPGEVRVKRDVLEKIRKANFSSTSLLTRTDALRFHRSTIGKKIELLIFPTPRLYSQIEGQPD